MSQTNNHLVHSELYPVAEDLKMNVIVKIDDHGYNPETVVNQIQKYLIDAVNRNQVKVNQEQNTLIKALEEPTTNLDGWIADLYLLLEERSRNSEWMIKDEFNNKTSTVKAAVRALRVKIEELIMAPNSPM